MDDNSSGHTSLADSSSLTATSLHSGNSTQNINDGFVHVYNYQKRDFERFQPTMHCEEVCTIICRSLEILPTAQLLFGIREHAMTSKTSHTEVQHKWVLPGEQLRCEVRYCFRMRFKVPELDRQLELIDPHCHKYLYYQMRYDMLHEHISEIRYPEHKDKVMGLAVMDMLIDKEELQQTTEYIEKLYKNYLPHSLWRAHRIFVKLKIRSTFRKLALNQPKVESLKWHYVHQIYDLAPTYLTERFNAKVDYVLNEKILVGGMGGNSISSSVHTSNSTLLTGSNITLSTTTTNGLNTHPPNTQRDNVDHFIPVYVKLSLHDSPEPGLKVARVTSESSLKWILATTVENIIEIYMERINAVRLDITGIPKGYILTFYTEDEKKSFISYLAIYYRLTVNWMPDLCKAYIPTPSLTELCRLKCHGPIGGSYSFAKLHLRGEQCGNYIVRQCDREYNTYYIDINTKVVTKSSHHKRCQTETFKITQKDKQYKLVYNGSEYTFDQLPELAKFIHAESPDRVLIGPSSYDMPPLLLLCLPKNPKAKKTDAELSENELQREKTRILTAETDLQWYKDSIRHTDDARVITMRGDWIQQGSFKDVPVTMKMLQNDKCPLEFINLAQKWTLMQSPQFVKLYGLTLSAPFTMVMEYAKYGTLKEFLLKHKNISILCLLDVVHGLVSGIHYLNRNRIIHNYIRCNNLYVTKYIVKENILDAKIGDPGLPRPYVLSDSPWIPIEYYKKLENAKRDPTTQLWAFATTMWEIFSRGQIAFEHLEQSDFVYNFRRAGGILQQLDTRLCPAELYESIMDGWSDDPDKRFNNHDINTRLIAIKNQVSSNYENVDNDMESYNETLGENGEDDVCNGDSEVDTGLDSAGHDYSFFETNPMSNGTMGLRQEFFSTSHFRYRRLVIQLDDCKVIYRQKDIIGMGHYGSVFRGKLVYNDTERPNEQVAIKKLKSVNKKITNDFQREIDIMRKLDHPNVVKFKYFAERSLSIIMEYIENGSFDVYLSMHKALLKNSHLLKFASDIANGMNYLSGKGLIHRDLAARNILVDRGCVKISDFGLAQFANEDGYYIAISQRDIPIKWYSPEAIKTCKFSSYSDVWSYGVTLLEMFSRGEPPNLVPGLDLNQEDFLNRLLANERFPKPEQCPDLVYNKLMMPCWEEIPKSRPTFGEIIQIIEREMGELLSTEEID